jgi:hypothetical protein
MKKSAKKTSGIARHAPKDLTPRTSVGGGDNKTAIVSQMATSIANLQHETVKAIAQNLRA